MQNNKNLFLRIFTFEGASITVGVIGVLAGLAAFIGDVSAKISVGWFLLTAWVLLTLLFIFIRVAYTLNSEHYSLLETNRLLHNENAQLKRETGATFYEKPIKFVPESGNLVIRKNDHFTNQILVAIYHTANDYESIACLGKVVHSQEKLIQIKILDYDFPEKKGFDPQTDLGVYRVRPVVPLYTLQHLIEN